MNDDLSALDEVRRLADELDVQVHLASMNARDRWAELQPRLDRLEHSIVHSGERVSDAVVHELHEVRDALRSLRDEVFSHARGDFTGGW